MAPPNSTRPPHHSHSSSLPLPQALTTHISNAFLTMHHWLQFRRQRQQQERSRRLRLARLRCQRTFMHLQSQQEMFRSLSASLVAVCTVAGKTGLIGGKGEEREKSQAWWRRFEEGEAADEEWVESFRMSQGIFEYLTQELEDHLQFEDIHLRELIPPNKCLAMTLWCLGNSGDYHVVSKQFGVDVPLVGLVVKEICEAMVAVLQPRFVGVPSGPYLDEVVRSFEEICGIPQCAGVVGIVDLSVIPASARTRVMWTGEPVAAFQILVDHRGLISHVSHCFVGYHSTQDILLTGELYARREAGSLFPTWTKNIGGAEVPLVVVANSNFPLTSWTITPYMNASLSETQSTFNANMQLALDILQEIVRKLQCRWRILLEKGTSGMDCLESVLAACCVLHNLCEVRGDEFQEEWGEGVEGVKLRTEVEEDSEDIEGSEQGVAVRDALAAYVVNRDSQAH